MVNSFIKQFSNGYLWKIIGLLLVIATLGSCTSTKTITYFQKKESANEKYNSTLASIEQMPLRIQPDDILAIVVNSLSEETNLIFNAVNTNTIQVTSFPGVATSPQPLGYTVDQSGEVNLPISGRIKLAGLTLKEASVSIENILSKYIKDPSVKVRLLNHKFTVIGEVNRPGIYNLFDKPTTLPDVIGTAGELTLYGRRDNVMLIRMINNKREVIRLDLTSQQVLNSPYYFIENNDVIYVESRPGRITTSDRTLQLIPSIVASITATLLIYNVFAR